MFDAQLISAIITGFVAIIIFVGSSIGNIILFFSNKRLADKNIEMQRKNNELTMEVNKASNAIQFANSTLQSLDNQKERISTYISDNRVVWMQTMKKYVMEYLDEIYKYNNNQCEGFDIYFQKLQSKTVQIKLHLNYLGNADKNILKEISALNRMLELKSMEGKINSICSNDEEEVVKEVIMSLRKLEYYYVLTDGNAFHANSNIWEQLLEDSGDNRTELRHIYLEELKKFNEFVTLKPQVIIIYAEVYLKTEWERVKFEIENGNHNNYKFDEKYSKNLKKVKNYIEDIETFINYTNVFDKINDI